MTDNLIICGLAAYALLAVCFIAEGLYHASGWLWKRWKGILGMVVVLFLAGSAKADPLPNLIQITANVSWTFPLCCQSGAPGTTESFHVSYELQNIGEQPQFFGDPFNDPFGGNYVLVPNTMSFSASGPLGPFALSLSEPGVNVFHFDDPVGNSIQFFWEEKNIWKIPGDYLGGSLELWTAPGVAFPNTLGEFFGVGSIDVERGHKVHKSFEILSLEDAPLSTPEPGVLALMMLPLVWLALRKRALS